MSFVLIQVLNGLSYASTLFMMAAGLTLIFGVTRIVNFAHGSFYMLGALLAAHGLVTWAPGWADSALTYALAILLAGLACAALGAVMQLLVLSRLQRAPELYQLVATFGLTLVMHDLMRASLGPQEVFAPRFPGLKGSIEIASEFFPVWHLAVIALGGLTWLALHLLLSRTVYGRRLRAATQDRDMLDALGVNPKPLMISAVMLGCGLAGLAGALRLPSEPAHLQMDVQVVVETFVVVVTGGLGSIGGALAAAVLIGLVHAFGVSLFPQATLVIVFLTMALILALRPHGLAGSLRDAPVREPAQVFIAPPSIGGLWPGALVLVALAGLAGLGGEYWRSLASDTLILLIFGISLQLMMAFAGIVSFGHAAFFGLGAYGAAWAHVSWSVSLPFAVLCGTVLSLAVAAAFGAAVIRSAGVYLAMLSLALAQVLWAAATQWVSVTGGDNGIIGLHLVEPGGGDWMLLLLVVIALAFIVGTGYLSRTAFGAALQAGRDAPERALASGLRVGRLRYKVFLLSSALAGVAGGLAAAHKGAVFPSSLAVSTSLDALLVVLLGGLHQLWGPLAGSVVLSLAGAELGRGFEYWRGVLGLIVVLAMVRAPQGLMGLLGAGSGSPRQ